MTSIPSFVIFNVAGQRFTTSSQTLLKEPSSRLALLARGVLPSIKDDTGAIFLDRDSHHFQLLLNYMRDSWCSLPASAQERRELLQEARWYQLTNMEAWLKAQEVSISLNESSLLPRPSSAPLDTSCMMSNSSSPFFGVGGRTSSILSTPVSPVQPAQQSFSVTTAMAGDATSLSPLGAAAAGSMSSMSPFRGSFLAGPNQDLLAAGALASCGILNSSIAGRCSSVSAAAGGGCGGYGSSKLSLMGAASAGLAEGIGAGYVGNYSPVGVGAAATAAASIAAPAPRVPMPLASDGYKWTHRLLQTNPRMQEVINTLLELAYLAPHTSLHAGKVSITFTSECSHDLGGLGGRTSSVLLMSAQQQLEAARFRNQVVHVSSVLGWAFELAVRGSSDVAVHGKYNLAGFLQDNWFMVTAVLKEQYGIHLEEDLSSRPSCLACRRNNISLNMQRIY